MSGFILEYRNILDIFKEKGVLENRRKKSLGARNQRNLVGSKDVPNKFFSHYFSARSA